MRIPRTAAGDIGAPANRLERDRTSIAHNILAGLSLATLLLAPAPAVSAKENTPMTATCLVAPSAATRPTPQQMIDTCYLSSQSRLERDPEQVPTSVASPVTERALAEGRALKDLIAELPRIEDLVPSQALAAFMQPWVPTDIQTAALRRMWLIDPAIGDFVDPATDYAHDYNTPGGAPGYGPMEPTAEMVREVNAMFERAAKGNRVEPITASTQALWPRAWTH
jgi:hypothetical protein